MLARRIDVCTAEGASQKLGKSLAFLQATCAAPHRIEFASKPEPEFLICGASRAHARYVAGDLRRHGLKIPGAAIRALTFTEIRAGNSHELGNSIPIRNDILKNGRLDVKGKKKGPRVTPALPLFPRR